MVAENSRITAIGTGSIRQRTAAAAITGEGELTIFRKWSHEFCVSHPVRLVDRLWLRTWRRRVAGWCARTHYYTSQWWVPFLSGQVDRQRQSKKRRKFKVNSKDYFTPKRATLGFWAFKFTPGKIIDTVYLCPRSHTVALNQLIELWPHKKSNPVRSWNGFSNSLVVNLCTVGGLAAVASAAES